MKESTPPKSPLLVTALQLGLLVFAIYYTFIGGQTAQGIYDHTWRWITLWLMTFLIGLWLLWRWISPHKIPRTPLDFPLLFLGVAWILASLFSVNPVYSQESLVFFMTYLFFFYIAADLGRQPWFIGLTFNAIIGVAGLVWTLALLQLSWWYRDYVAAPAILQAGLGLEPNLPRLSVLGNPNTMASYIALVLPLVLYNLMTARRLITRILLGIWLMMLVGALLLTQSRGGWLAFIVALSFYLAVWIIQEKGRLESRLRSLQIPGKLKSFLSYPQIDKWLVIVMIAGLFGAFIWLTLSLRGFGQGLDIRQQVMAGAIKTWLKYPIFGAGPGTLGEELIRNQKPLTALWADAHNLFLTLLAETGLLGAIGLGWLGLACTKLAKGLFRPSNGTSPNLVGAVCAAALLGFVAHNMVDSLFKFPLIMLMVAILAGFWVSASLVNGPPTADRRPPLSKVGDGVPIAGSAAKVWGYPAMAAAILVIVVNLIIGLWSVQHIRFYNQAVEAAGRGDWQATVEGLQSAHHLAPATPFYRQQLGFALGQLAQSGPAYRQEAIAQYRAALAGMDQLTIDHANLACLLWLDNQPAEAIREMRLAKRLDPQTYLYRLNLGYYLEQTGEAEGAQREYADLLAVWPQYIQSDYWLQQEARAARLAETIDLAAQALVEQGETGWLNLIELYLDGQNLETARQVYKTYSGDKPIDPRLSHLAAGKILFAQEELEAARVEFEAALQIDPNMAEAHLYLSRIALAKGDFEDANAYSEAALFLEQSPAVFYQAGLAAEAAGNRAGAIDQYEAAFAGLTKLPESLASPYATEVARRRPMPAGHLPCLKTIYPTRLLAAITQTEGDLLEQQGDYEKAGQLYRRLLNYEPGVQPVAARLETLCQDYAGVCGH